MKEGLYTGKPVKTSQKEGLWEVIKIDYFTQEVICIPINSIENKIETFRISTLKDL